MKLSVALFALSLSAAIGSGYYPVKPPITLCTKEDFSACVNITYPTNCVDLNTVRLNSADGGGTVSSVDNRVESVIVSDVDDESNRCVVLFDAYACQGRSLVLGAPALPSAVLYKHKFANLARSIRPCTDKLLKWLLVHPYIENPSKAAPMLVRATDVDVLGDL